MATKEDNIAAELVGPADGGSVLSNPSTISALRQGVEIDLRLDALDVADAHGGTHRIPLALTEAGGAVNVVVLQAALDEADRRAPGPRRRAGTVKLGSVESFIEYVSRFKATVDDDTVIFAPLDPPSLTAIFDYHGHGDEAPRWCGDRASYECPLSRQWKLWTKFEGAPLSQTQFGDLIEQNSDDLQGDEATGLASAAKMLEVARNLVIHSAGKFERKINPTTGEGTLVVDDSHAPTSTKIPKAFGLAIPVFEGSADLYPVECRIRFAMVEGRPQFSYVIHNRQQVFDHALTELRTNVGKACGVPVFVGVPPAAPAAK
jgi:uncharacterized protein YfdQ (DUF2303 family)